MNGIKEVRFFECTCSKCGKIVQNKRGLVDLRADGWKDVGKILFCPVCFAPYENLDPQTGDIVRCLVKDDSYRQVKYMETYQVCERVDGEPGAIYVDLQDGWQAMLERGEYQIVTRRST